MFVPIFSWLSIGLTVIFCPVWLSLILLGCPGDASWVGLIVATICVGYLNVLSLVITPSQYFFLVFGRVFSLACSLYLGFTLLGLDGPSLGM